MIRRNDVQPIVKGDKRVIQGWVMYDWANSVYQLTIASAIFPIYYNTVTRTGDNFTVSFFGTHIINTVLYSWAIAVAYLLVAIMSPLFSSMADYTGRRKGFMRAFTLIGAISCAALFFFDKNHIELGVIAFALGTIGYGGSIVFYNSFLPVIAAPEDQDRISARGYSMGYMGGVVLLLFNLLMIMKPGLFGIASDSSLPARISFVTVFLWWIGFSQITFSRLPKYTFRQRTQRDSVWVNGYKELRVVFNYIRKSAKLSLYLTGFFFLMMGVLTTMFMAATYGEKQLGLKEDVLIPTILAIQLVGMLGAWMFARISERLGNLRALMITIVTWTLICIGAFYIIDAIQFLTAAFFIGIVMGGSQSLARSTYSKMLPADTTAITNEDLLGMKNFVSHPESASKIAVALTQMMIDQPNILYADLGKIKCPVLVMAGDHDMIKPEHTIKIYQSIPSASLCIFPDSNHGVCQQHPDLFNSTVLSFFMK